MAKITRTITTTDVIVRTFNKETSLLEDVQLQLFGKVESDTWLERKAKQAVKQMENRQFLQILEYSYQDSKYEMSVDDFITYATNVDGDTSTEREE